METRRKLNQEEKLLTEKQLKSVLLFGLVICAMTIIASVDYLFNSKMYSELAITTILFTGIVFLIRRLNK